MSELVAPVYKDFFLDWTTKHYAISGGRSSAKGDAVYTKAVLACVQKPNAEVRVYVPITSTITDGVLKQIGKVCNRMGITYDKKVTSSRIRFPNGSEIIIKGLAMDNANKKAESFKGGESETGEIELVIFDEIGGMNDREKMNVITNSFIRNTRQFVYVWNPPMNMNHWTFDFRTEMANREDGAYLHTTLYDLPESWVEWPLKEAEQRKIYDYEGWLHEFMGEAAGYENLAFPLDIQTIIVDELPKTFKYFDIFIDNGQKDATVFGLYGITYDGDSYLIDTFYHSGRATGEVLPDSTYFEKLIEWKNERISAVRQTYCDSLSFQAEGKKHNYPIKHMTNKRRVEQYTMTRELVLSGRFFIYNKPENAIFIQQMKNAELELAKDRYGFDKPAIAKVDNASVPEKRQIHALDTFMYFALVNWNELNKMKEVKNGNI